MENKEYNKLIENLFTPVKKDAPLPKTADNATYDELVAQLFDSPVEKSTK